MKEGVTKVTGTALAALLAAACTAPRTTRYDPDHPPELSPICTYLPVFEQNYAVMATGPEAGMPISPDDQQQMIGNAALKLLEAYPTPKEWTESPATVGTVTAYLTKDELDAQLLPFAQPDYMRITDEVRNAIISQAQARIGENVIAPKRIIIDISSDPVPHPAQSSPGLRHIGIMFIAPYPYCTTSVD